MGALGTDRWVVTGARNEILSGRREPRAMMWILSEKREVGAGDCDGFTPLECFRWLAKRPCADERVIEIDLSLRVAEDIWGGAGNLAPWCTAISDVPFRAGTTAQDKNLLYVSANPWGNENIDAVY